MTAGEQGFTEAVLRTGLIAIVRLPETGGATNAVRALLQGGINIVEVTLTSPDALESIRALAPTMPRDAYLGAGSVRTPADVLAASDAGVQFLVTPTFNRGVMAAANELRIPVLCGALSPTEMDAAQRSGAAFVKLFPAATHGPQYLREVLAPLPDLRVVPTGGVSLENLEEWFDSGACAVAVGGSLVSGRDAESEEWDLVVERARSFVDRIAALRGGAVK